MESIFEHLGANKRTRNPAIKTSFGIWRGDKRYQYFDVEENSKVQEIPGTLHEKPGDWARQPPKPRQSSKNSWKRPSLSRCISTVDEENIEESCKIQSKCIIRCLFVN